MRTDTTSVVASVASMTSTSGGASGTPVAAATSRATPNTLRRSGRFGSISMSKTASSRPSTVFTSSPIANSAASRSRIPP
jgi:hypothetical protein